MKTAIYAMLVAASLGGAYAFGTWIWGTVARSRANEQLPAVAKGLGLAIDGRGYFEGEFRGREIYVRPDATSFTTAFGEAPELFLTTVKKYTGRIPPELEAFETGDARFDKVFRTKRASGAVAGALRADTELRATLLALADGRGPRLGSLTVSPTGGVSGRVYEGGPWVQHIPPGSLETLLERLVAVADALEYRLR